MSENSRLNVGGLDSVGSVQLRSQSPATHIQTTTTTTTATTTTALYPKCGCYFTKARQGLEKCLKIPTMPDGVGWKLSQFDYEGEMKSKENKTKNGCVEGPTITGLVNTT